MSFIDEVKTRSNRFAQRVEHLRNEQLTEEATKTSLVLPFIQMLGYEIFDPTEVLPEFTADVGMKRGEKVDYALMQNGHPAILIECKKLDDNLADAATSQLVRYFGVTSAHFGVLTNGITYRFFSDLDQPNVMDTMPFFEFNMLDFSDKGVEELRRFTKDEFDLDEAVQAASVLKYIDGMKQALERQLKSPDEDFSRWLTKQVYSKPLTQPTRDRFSHLVRQAFRELVDDRVNATLKSALARDLSTGDDTTEPTADVASSNPGIVTTSEETEGYELVKSIVIDVVDPERVFLRDTQNYCGILLDNNNRKPIARLYFNAVSNKRLQLPVGGVDASGRREMVEYSIESVGDITWDSPDQTNFPGHSSFWDTVKYNPAFQGRQMRPDSLKFPVFI